MGSAKHRASRKLDDAFGFREKVGKAAIRTGRVRAMAYSMV